jgi:hypothetical protein
MKVYRNTSQRKFVGKSIRFIQDYLKANKGSPNSEKLKDKIREYAKIKYGITLNLANQKEYDKYMMDEYKKSTAKNYEYTPSHNIKDISPATVRAKAKKEKQLSNINDLHEKMLLSIKRFDEKINKLRYAEFLKTDYWAYVRELKIKQQPKCKCGADRLLQVHHITYKHHYHEHLHLDDLVVLCDPCHKKEHRETFNKN